MARPSMSFFSAGYSRPSSGSIGRVRWSGRVKLQDGGAVEGDIFHRSLTIEGNSVFEGSSRRVENPTDAPADAKRLRDEDVRNSALAPYLQRVEPSASTEWSDSTVEPKQKH
jgi:hypothetical protein